MTTPPATAFSSTQTVRVACIGDSITYGDGVRDFTRDNSYPAMLGRLLGIGWDVRNFGVSGTTILARGDSPYMRTEACTAALAFCAGIVVIKLGTNDSKRPRPTAPDAPDNWKHRDDYVEDYLSLIEAFHRANQSARIFVCTPVPAYPGNWGIDNTTIREDVVPRVRTVAVRSEARLIDLYSALSGHDECFPDTVHPNETGAVLIAAAVQRALLT